MSTQSYIVRQATNFQALQALIDDAVAKGLKPLFVTESKTGYTVIFG